ncbi:hypothetical protein LCGC14_2504040, partial [marine sediment metagenome]
SLVFANDDARAMMNLAGSELCHLPGLNSDGVFLPSGRLYMDLGSHPEFCTPECLNPWDVVRYALAGDRIMADLAAGASASPQLTDVRVRKGNVDYASRATWGCHESYSHRSGLSAMSGHLIPHLVSRICFTGAGGFNALAPGLEFMLSPRVAHLSSVISGDSTHARGIYHTKNEPLAGDGSYRLHLLCGESLCSHVACWLKVGTTALVVSLIEAGRCPGNGVQLGAPLTAMGMFARDPQCKVQARLLGGGLASAVAIQRHYLELAEANLDADFMPPWADEVCRQWRGVLDLLAGAPESAATTLDWAIKLAMYRNRLGRHQGIEWKDLPHWSIVLAALQDALQNTPHAGKQVGVDFVLASGSPLAPTVTALTGQLRRQGLKWEQFRAFLELRLELFEIDTRFGQLGGGGIFDSLDAAGVLTHRLDGVDDIDHAMTHPPARGRAHLRGNCIRQFAGDNGMISEDDRMETYRQKLDRVLAIMDKWPQIDRQKMIPTEEFA